MQRVWSPRTARHQVRVDGALGEGVLVAGCWLKSGQNWETMDFSGPFNYAGGVRKHTDFEHGKSCCHVHFQIFFLHLATNPNITWQDALKLKTKLYDPFPGAPLRGKFQVGTTLP